MSPLFSQAYIVSTLAHK